jgi:acyl-CoA synthetase (AMP-forming)/AMP-acid ligase II
LISSPAEAKTLAEILHFRAETTPARSSYVYLKNGKDESASLTYGELDYAARMLAQRLQQLGAEGERVLLLYPHGLDFVIALFGCFYAGAVAVPALPATRSEQSSERLQAILADATPRFVFTTEMYADSVADDTLHVEITHELFAVDQSASPSSWVPSAVDPDAICMLQYTSGSTGDPKGVMLTHANILHNQEMILGCFEHSPESVVVSWLPVYHDMGLIGMLMQPLFVGNRCILMSPMAFMQRPLRWLQAITKYRATTSGGPNFAYEACVDRIKPEDCADLDLSSLEIAYSGAEPIRVETLDRFSDRFEACGFRRQAFYPCYGLAEATLLVTGGRKMAALRLLEVNSGILESEHRAVAARGTDAGRVLVGCGSSPSRQALRIVNPDTHEVLADGLVGEILVAGPCIAKGYWNRPRASREIFDARIDGDDTRAYLRTGDLGFLLEGELYVAGRLKDVLIIRGRNHYPQDIEATAESCHAALRPAGSAAILVERGGGERLVLVMEMRREHKEKPDVTAIAGEVRQGVTQGHGLQAASVVLLKSGTLPRTTSGKIRRAECRSRLLAGELPILAEDSYGGPFAAALAEVTDAN